MILSCHEVLKLIEARVSMWYLMSSKKTREILRKKTYISRFVKRSHITFETLIKNYGKFMEKIHRKLRKDS